MDIKCTVTSRVKWLMVLICVVLPATSQGQTNCSQRVNNSIPKLLECVKAEGVRSHQAAFQAIADANGERRSAGSLGAQLSANYVADKMRAVGYQVSVQEFQINYAEIGPSAMSQTSPVLRHYQQGSEFAVMGFSTIGDVTATVANVDLYLGLGNTSTSGCEAADFAGFPPGSIALMQRGTCTFQVKAENASAAGAVGAIIFNQGNTEERMGLPRGSVGEDFAGGIPVMETTYDVGVELATNPDTVVRLFANVKNTPSTAYNVIADSASGDANNVVVAGAHLDSVAAGPGIQDNGAASAALLETALQMASVKPRNKLRFIWWGLVETLPANAAAVYLNSLTAAQQGRLALYLNFDTIASPNFVYFVYDGAEPGLLNPAGSARIQQLFEAYYTSVGKPHKTTFFARNNVATSPFDSLGIAVGGVFTGATELKTAEEAALWGGVAGTQYDPCYHLACDTFDNISLEALDVNADAVAYSVLQYGMSTAAINGLKGKGGFKSKIAALSGGTAIE